jgi:antitoxin (DNA-binding transcriptional repressor) of toxin-antitoxin stability system
MKEITVRELRNNGSAVINRVLSGESLLVTRDGADVAELHPVHQRPTHISVLRKKWQGLPSFDPVALRGDIDSIIDQSIS